jgi:hypothetical protein
MMTTPTLSQNRAPARRRRTATVTIVTLLLLGQALLLLATFPGLLLLGQRGAPQQMERIGYVLSDGLRLLREGAWTITPESTTLPTPAGSLSVPTGYAAGIWFLPLAPFTLLAAALFFFLYRPAWALVLLLQCAVLFIALRLYVTYREPYTCLLMLPAVLIIGYLNQFDLRALFTEDVRRTLRVVRDLTSEDH